jgi:hypothetical protein
MTRITFFCCLLLSLGCGGKPPDVPPKQESKPEPSGLPHRTNVCFIYFPKGKCDLERAAQSLKKYGLEIQKEGETLTATRPGKPLFTIRLTSGDAVRSEASRISEGSRHAAAMRDCDTQFEISFADLDEVLDETNTLIEVQGALQDASQGFLFLPWNGNLSEPFKE